MGTLELAAGMRLETSYPHEECYCRGLVIHESPCQPCQDRLADEVMRRALAAHASGTKRKGRKGAR